MKKTVWVFFVSAWLIMGCGKSSTPAPPASKSFFSLWKRSDGVVLDLSGGSFGGSFPMSWILKDGSKCTSTVLVIGDETSGAANSSNSTYVAGSGAGTDPGCSVLNQSATYTKAGNTLTLCAPAGGSSCGTYN